MPLTMGWRFTQFQNFATSYPMCPQINEMRHDTPLRGSQVTLVDWYNARQALKRGQGEANSRASPSWHAPVVELVDASDSKSLSFGSARSSRARGTSFFALKLRCLSAFILRHRFAA